MAYLALYRKYRPQTFAAVFGQEHVTRTLQNAVAAGHVAHAYLFCGPRGTGKTTTARLLAKALNCERGPIPEPCNACDSCRQIAVGSSLDVIEIDAASNRGIDQIRDLRERVYNATAGGRYRVYIVDEVHMLTGEAFNALLKTLEEPPGHIIFVLATTEAQKIPATIASRCQRFDFRRGAADQLRQQLMEVASAEGAPIEDEALDLLARAAAGSWRDALSLLEQVMAYAEARAGIEEVTAVLGTLAPDALDHLVAAVLNTDGAALFRRMEDLIAAGKDPRQLLTDIAEHFRDLMLTAAGSCPLGEGQEAARLRERARQAGLARLVSAVELLAQADGDLRGSEHPRLMLDLAMARLLRLFGSEPAAATTLPAPSSPESVRNRPVGETAAPPAARPRPAAAPPSRRQAAPPRLDSAPEPPPARPSGAPAETHSAPGPDPWDHLERQATSPPRPAPAVVAREATPPGEDTLEVERVRGQWSVIRQELNRRRQKSLAGLIADAVPVGLAEGVLHVQFPSATLAEMFQVKGAEHEQPLSEVIYALCGIRCRIQALAPGAGPPPARPASPATPKPAPDAKPAAPPPTAPTAGRELVHDVVDLFDGQIVGDRDLETR